MAPGFLLLFLLISQTLRFEPSIRVSPDSMAGTPDAVVHEGRFMCVVWRGRAYLSYSLDYGRSWHFVRLVEYSPVVTDVAMWRGNIYVAWCYEPNVYFTCSFDTGRTWMEPVQVNPPDQVPDCMDCGIAVGPGGEIYVAFTGRTPSWDVCCVASLDSGRTWSDVVKVNGDMAGIQGLNDIEVGEDGTVYVLWIDRMSDTLFLSSSRDTGRTWEREAVDSDVGGGHLAISGENLYVEYLWYPDWCLHVRSRVGGYWYPRVLVPHDTVYPVYYHDIGAWGNNVYVVWNQSTPTTPRGHVFCSFSLRGGRVFSSPLVVSGSLRWGSHPVVAADSFGVYVVHMGCDSSVVEPVGVYCTRGRVVGVGEGVGVRVGGDVGWRLWDVCGRLVREGRCRLELKELMGGLGSGVYILGSGDTLRRKVIWLRR